MEFENAQVATPVERLSNSTPRLAVPIIGSRAKGRLDFTGTPNPDRI